MELTKGPLDRVAPTYASIFAGTFGVLGACWTLVLPVTVLVSIPRWVIVWFWDAPLWAKITYTVLLSTVAEALVMRLCADRLLGGHSGLRAAWRSTLPRLPSVMVVNLVENVVVLALMVTCVGAIFVGGIVMPAIPIALLEPAGPVQALRQAWERGKSRWLMLSLIALTMMGVEVVSGVPGGMVAGLVKAGALHSDPYLLSAARVFSELMITLYRVVNWPLELVTWAATLQRPLFTYGTAPDQAARL
jgi:hypothetical protein